MKDILSSLVLPSRKNLKGLKYSGLDSPGNALDHNHFNEFPFDVSYSYNSRGFRDDEWPETIEELRDAIWCIGDSFTAGIGQPRQHIWPQRLQERLKRRTINVSLDGASNDWIARRCLDIIKEVAPKDIVICWSYLHRRELPNANLYDEDRRVHVSTFDSYENVVNFIENYTKINQLTNTKFVNLTVPHCLVEDNYAVISGQKDPAYELDEVWNTIRGSDWPVIYPGSKDLNTNILEELAKLNFLDRLGILKYLMDAGVSLLNYELTDLARDGHHFGKRTVLSIVDGIVEKLK